jgi:hypothetical protein
MAPNWHHRFVLLLQQEYDFINRSPYLFQNSFPQVDLEKMKSGCA